jgi:accessory gene regulator B
MHLDTYSQCFSASVTVFSAVILIISKMSLNIWLFALTIISGLIIAYIGTVNHPNLGLVENEIIILKKRTRFMLAIEFIILLVLALLRVLETVAVCIEFSIIMCALLMLLAKLLRQEVN